MSIEYIAEKMDQVIRALGTDPRPLPERLEAVYVPVTSAISEAEAKGVLPAEALARLRGARDRLSAREPSFGEDKLEATLARMTSEAAVQLAEDLMTLADEVFEIADALDADAD